MPKAGSEPTLDGAGIPMWLVCELTYRCPLHCAWCSNPLDFDRYRDELYTDEWIRVLREARAMGSLQLGFSGGEPMLRGDLETLVAEAEKLGFYTNLITSGIGLTRERLADLKAAGLKQIQLSLQASSRELTDTLVGAPAFAQKLAVAEDIKCLGFPMVLNVPVCRQNIDDTAAILDLAEQIGVDYLEFANIQYYNWALLNRSELLPTRQQLERAEAVVQAARRRIGKRMTIYFVIPDYFDDRPKACMNGWGAIHLTIAPDGTALPCQEARVIETLRFPNVREGSLAWIWHDSPSFNAFRGDAWMKEPCRGCEEREHDFGGCRCQAFLLTGDAANADPVCAKSPHHDRIRATIDGNDRMPPIPRPLVMRRRGAISTGFMGKGS